jgi:hypothetical protein
LDVTEFAKIDKLKAKKVCQQGDFNKKPHPETGCGF